MQNGGTGIPGHLDLELVIRFQTPRAKYRHKLNIYCHEPKRHPTLCS